MSLTSSVTSNQPGGASAYMTTPPLGGASQTGSSSPAAQLLGQLLKEIGPLIQQLTGGQTPPAGGTPAFSQTPPSGGTPAFTNAPPSGGTPAFSNTPPAGGTPAFSQTPPVGSSNTNLSSVQLQVGTSGGGKDLMQGPKGLDGSSDLYLPQKDGSEKHIGKMMGDGSIKFDNMDDAKDVLGKGGMLLNGLGGKLHHNGDGTATLDAGAATLTAGNLPAPT